MRRASAEGSTLHRRLARNPGCPPADPPQGSSYRAPVLTAELDPRLSARVVRRVALHYQGGADPALDRPAHVRAASGLTWWRGRLAVVSDDASFLGLVDPVTGLTEPYPLPPGPGGLRQFDSGRGNKAHKLDLESVCVFEDALWAFGSDSGLAARRRAAVLDRGQARVVDLPRLYAALRHPALGAGELNLEASAVLDDQLVLGNRGGDVGPDGRPTHDGLARLPLAALAALLAAPELASAPAVHWQLLALGALDGAALRLTELEPWGRVLLYAATAEATTSAYDDGAVTGSALGVIAGTRARWTAVVDEHGARLPAKIEGLAVHGDRVLATVDADDPDRPSTLLELVLDGPWAS